MLATPARADPRSANCSEINEGLGRRGGGRRRKGLLDLLVDEVEVGELAGVGAGALLAGGGLLLLGEEIAPGEARLLHLVLGAGAGRRRVAASWSHGNSLPPPPPQEMEDGEGAHGRLTCVNTRCRLPFPRFLAFTREMALRAGLGRRFSLASLMSTVFFSDINTYSFFPNAKKQSAAGLLHRVVASWPSDPLDPAPSRASHSDSEGE